MEPEDVLERVFPASQCDENIRRAYDLYGEVAVFAYMTARRVGQPFEVVIEQVRRLTHFFS